MLFLYHETYYVTPGMQTVVDERVRSLHENHATHPAFVAGDWLRPLGDPMTYVAYRLWSEREVDFDAAQMAFMSEYNRTRPPDAFIHGPSIEYFELTARTAAPGMPAGDSSAPRCFVQSDIEPANRGAWMGWERGLRDVLLAAEGFREYRMYRFLGGENRFMRAELWRDLADAERFWHDPAMRVRMAELGTRPFRRAPRIGYFELLHQVEGAGKG
jgi:quinol monooxygenase YgiN